MHDLGIPRVYLHNIIHVAICAFGHRLDRTFGLSAIVLKIRQPRKKKQVDATHQQVSFVSHKVCAVHKPHFTYATVLQDPSFVRKINPDNTESDRSLWPRTSVGHVSISHR